MACVAYAIQANDFIYVPYMNYCAVIPRYAWLKQTARLTYLNSRRLLQVDAFIFVLTNVIDAVEAYKY